MLLVVGRVGIGAAGHGIDAHEGGLQPAHGTILQEAGSGFSGINCRP